MVLTHIQDWGEHERLLEADASGVLPKGITFEEVLAAVRRLGGRLLLP